MEAKDPGITAEISFLAQLHHDKPDILKRYLATSPSWRLFKERNALFATRRWITGFSWRYNLHGYYSRHDIYSLSRTVDNFQSKFTLGLSGKPWRRISGDSTRMEQGETRPLKLSAGNQMLESHCVINLDGLIVEVFEQSEAKERRLTKAALAHVNQELSLLAESPTWKSVKTAVPSGSIRRGEQSLILLKSSQPGIYDSEIWLNPCEPGRIYFKAFEFTKEEPLSVHRLKERSNEYIGWSEDPAELFFSKSHFTIYEGDWGKPYAARSEVWFVPDSGAVERRLMEKIFKIEGWQR